MKLLTRLDARILKIQRSPFLKCQNGTTSFQWCPGDLSSTQLGVMISWMLCSNPSRELPIFRRILREIHWPKNEPNTTGDGWGWNTRKYFISQWKSINFPHPPDKKDAACNKLCPSINLPTRLPLSWAFTACNCIYRKATPWKRVVTAKYPQLMRLL